MMAGCEIDSNLLTFSYSVSETVDRHDIEGINVPPICCGVISLATDI